MKSNTNTERSASDTAQLAQAIDQGLARYFSECRAQVPGFVRKHFRYPGAWRTNRRGLGWDLLRSPLNLMWVPLYLLVQLLAWILARLGIKRVALWLRRCPVGMRTEIQRYLIECTEQELLQFYRPGDQAAGSQRMTGRLRECIVEAIVEAEQLTQLSAEAEQRLEKNLNDALRQYALTRTANADISNTLLATVAGAFTLQKFTPGGIAVGFALAGVLANRLAAWNFFLGAGVGQWYYSLFPVEPGLELVVLSTAGVMLLFSVFACFSGLITDPIQALTGMHKRRLLRMLSSLERDLKSQNLGSFRPKDAYLARLMDIIDAARAGVA